MIRHLLQSGQENVHEPTPYSWGDTRTRMGIFLLDQILELWLPKAPEIFAILPCDVKIPTALVLLFGHLIRHDARDFDR